MAGIDFSQSVQENQAVEHRSSDKGFWFALGLFLLLLLAWGGLRAGMMFVDRQIQDTLAKTQDARDRMTGKDVDQIADFYTRADVTGKALQARTLPEDQFLMLEKAILPGVRYVTYDYDADAGVVMVEAATTDFRLVAQQIGRLKEAPIVSAVRAGSATKEKKGADGPEEIVFDFELTLQDAGSIHQ